MSATVHALHFPPPDAAANYTLSSATVVGMGGERYLLSHGAAAQASRASLPSLATQARLAASCLLAPAVGDTVLITQADDDSACFILAVLLRSDPSSGSVRLPGGNALHSSAQGLTLQADALDLNASSRLALSSAELQVNALAANMNAKHAQACFDTLDTQAVNVSLTAKTFSARVGRLLQRVVESFRQVQGLDETRAGRVKVCARDHHQIDAGHLTHKAEGFVKIDGKKIDLG